MDLNTDNITDRDYDMIPIDMYAQDTALPDFMQWNYGSPFNPMPYMYGMPSPMYGMPSPIYGVPSPMHGYGMNFMEMEEDDYRDKQEDYQDDMRAKKEYRPKEINTILMKIEKYNPGVFRYLRMYGISYQDAKRYIRRIIRLTLMYYED